MNGRSENSSASLPESHLGPNNAQSGPDYDPVNLMSQVFVDISTFLGPASDILLSWLLRLPRSIPPADAAQKVLSEIVEHCSEVPSEEGAKFIELLNQVATHNLKDIEIEGFNKRRGGRSARVKD